MGSFECPPESRLLVILTTSNIISSGVAVFEGYIVGQQLLVRDRKATSRRAHSGLVSENAMAYLWTGIGFRYCGIVVKFDVGSDRVNF